MRACLPAIVPKLPPLLWYGFNCMPVSKFAHQLLCASCQLEHAPVTCIGCAIVINTGRMRAVLPEMSLPPSMVFARRLLFPKRPPC